MRFVKKYMVVLAFLALSQSGFSQNIEFVGSYDSLTNVLDVYVEHPYAYVCQHYESPSLVVLDISDPADPVFVSQWGTLNFCLDIEVVGNYAFIANDFGGFLILDISDPTNPFAVVDVALGARAYNLFVDNNLVYVAAGYKGLFIFDVSDPLNPLELSEFDTPGSASGIVVRDEIAYLSDFWDILHTIDVSDPSNPRLLGTVTEPGYARKGVAVTGDVAYVATWDSSVYIINIQDLANPYSIGRYDTPGHCLGLYISDYLYISDFEFGIQILDISNPANPVFVAGYNTPGGARSTTPAGDYIYVADTSSLQILRLIQTDVDSSPDELPKKIALLGNYPNPFNSSTRIEYSTTTVKNVKITVYDLLGRRVETLVDEAKQAGLHQVVWDASGYSSGVYFYRIGAGDFTETGKMILLK